MERKRVKFKSRSSKDDVVVVNLRTGGKHQEILKKSFEFKRSNDADIDEEVEEYFSENDDFNES